MNPDYLRSSFFIWIFKWCGYISTFFSSSRFYIILQKGE